MGQAILPKLLRCIEDTVHQVTIMMQATCRRIPHVSVPTQTSDYQDASDLC